MATVKKKKEKKKINTPAVAEQRVAGPLRTGVLLQWETGETVCHAAHTPSGVS